VCSSTCGQKSDNNWSVYIGVLVSTHRGFSILTNLSPSQRQFTPDKRELEKGTAQFKRTRLAGMNSYSGQVWDLLGRILAIELALRVRT
jgi:hypothetical protein